VTRTASAHGLTTPRPTDWRKSAACLTEDPALFFPTGDSGPSLLIIEQAKTVCRGCPVLDTCGQWATDNRVEYGIFGGLTEQERASVRRSTRRRHLTPEEAAAKIQEKQEPEKPRTLQSIYDQHTIRLYGGHVAWNGPKRVHYRGQVFTPKQFCFFLGRGQHPNGPVRPDCGNDECVLPAHLADTTERARCGTRPGYQRHRRNGETPCTPCRQANTDADNRLRRTGTSKVAV
jgi:hypothetical protein